jgi:hypothetical protein
MEGKEIQSVKRTAERTARYRPFSVVRFTDCVAKLHLPAMNRWAIVSRPLVRTKIQNTFLCKAGL